MSDKVTCPCGNEMHADTSDEWWFVDFACDKCEAEVTGIGPSGSVHWTSARDLRIARSEMQRQQFSADMNEWEGRGNHCF